jgi:hypothetical protein
MGREDQLIKELALTVPSEVGTRKAGRLARGSVRLGIGDDAAVIVPGLNTDLVVTCDAFLEDVHFLATSRSRGPPATPPRWAPPLDSSC